VGAAAGGDAVRRGIVRSSQVARFEHRCPRGANMLGRHFVSAYSSFDEVARLADRGLIRASTSPSTMVAGAGGTASAALRDRGAAGAAHAAGLPPLTGVAADQEGGIVAPSCAAADRAAALSTLAELPSDVRAGRPRRSGERMAASSRRSGHQNFAAGAGSAA